MKKIVDYNKLYIDNFSIIKSWFFVILVCFLLVFILSKINYEKYYINNAVIVDDNIMRIYVSLDDLNILNNNNKLKIENKFFAYKIMSIDETEYLNHKYYQLLLNVKIDKNYNILNNYIEFKILEHKENVLKYIFDKLGV